MNKAFTFGHAALLIITCAMAPLLVGCNPSEDVPPSEDVVPGEDDTVVAPEPEPQPPALSSDEEGNVQFTLIERDEKPFGSRDLKGLIWVTGFFFTSCPSTCYKKSLVMQDLEAKWGPKGIHFVSITVDPERDTPLVLRKYAEQFEAHPTRWRFLTGEFEDIKKIGKEFYRLPHEIQRNGHTEYLIVCDRDGNLRGYFDWQKEDKLADLVTMLGQLRAEKEEPEATTTDDESESASESADSE